MNAKIVGYSAVLVIVVGLSFFMGLWYAFTLRILWGWFVTPAFGTPVPTLAQVWGIGLMLCLFRPILPPRHPLSSGQLVTILLAPAVSLLIGGLIK